MSLWSPLLPTCIIQLDFRLYFFSLHSPSAHLIPALARLFSFICFISLYCHNVADHECSHRSLVQLISEVVLLQIGSLNLDSLHSFSGLRFQGEKTEERMDKHTLGRLAQENVKNFGRERKENNICASECITVFFSNWADGSEIAFSGFFFVCLFFFCQRSRDGWNAIYLWPHFTGTNVKAWLSY